MSDADTFRQETRAWLEENCPASMRRAVKSDKDQCIEAGMDDYISKPFKRQQFIDVIKNALEFRG